MSFPGWLLLAAAGAAQAAEPAQWQAVQGVQVIARGEPMAERRVARAEAFYAQHLLLETGIVFDIAPAEFEALRDRYDLRRAAPFVLSEWLEVRAVPDAIGEVRPLGYLHCSARVTWGTTKTCFRDADDDGRLDGVAVFQAYDFPEDGLRFQPIEPIPYHYAQQPREPVQVRGGTYVGPRLGLAWNHDRENRDSGRLLFYAQALGANYRADIDPPIVVDTAGLPVTIEIAGAQLTILAWDGRRPTVRVDRPFPARPIRLSSPRETVTLVFLGGSARHWRLEEIEAPLPGSPAADASE